MGGADVTFITNRTPLWSRDFPGVVGGSLTVLLEDQGQPDTRFDLIVTDAKGSQGNAARDYKNKHPDVPMFIVNFETSNWVEKYDPNYARNDSTSLEIAKLGDYFISISGLAKHHLIEWLRLPRTPAVSVLNPAINEHALMHAMLRPLRGSTRPYAVWVGHSHKYKGWDSAVKAVWSLGMPFDLVVLGEPGSMPRANSLHQIVNAAKGSEVDKFEILRGAHMCLAPSLFEGYGMVPGECLAAGTQVVVYDLPVLREAYGAPSGLNICEWNDLPQFCEITAQIAAEKKPALGVSEYILKGRCLKDMIANIKTLPHHS
jgi:glycosyltransferase involved in cell wall biosynthesis